MNASAFSNKKNKSVAARNRRDAFVFSGVFRSRTPAQGIANPTCKL
jgi:hypothetical protein